MPLVITEDPTNNVLKVYYKKGEFNYTVEYYYDEVIDDTKTKTLQETYGEQVNTYPDEPKTGYILDRVETLPLVITEDPSNNVLKVYYKKGEFDYTVEY